MMFSDNADPIRMFRVNRVTPFSLPSFLGVLGPMRAGIFRRAIFGISIRAGSLGPGQASMASH